MNADHQTYVDEMQFAKISLEITDASVDMDMKRYRQHLRATAEVSYIISK